MNVDPKALDLVTDEGWTIRYYLKRLLLDLWNEGEGFNSKRPFGNSGWELDLILPLIKAGYVEGTLDEDGYVEDYDERAGHEYIKSLIKNYIFVQDDK